jgi:hypothetical protein
MLCICQRCGKRFAAFRVYRRYCSNACRQAAYRERKRNVTGETAETGAEHKAESRPVAALRDTLHGPGIEAAYRSGLVRAALKAIDATDGHRLLLALERRDLAGALQVLDGLRVKG